VKELPEEERDPIDSIGNERWVPILDDMEWIKEFDPREVEEIRLAYFYAQSPHGTAGHNRLLLIAKLADRLSTLEDLVNAASVDVPGFHIKRIKDALITGKG
jgi:hypothetical protein